MIYYLWQLLWEIASLQLTDVFLVGMGASSVSSQTLCPTPASQVVIRRFSHCQPHFGCIETQTKKVILEKTVCCKTRAPAAQVCTSTADSGPIYVCLSQYTSPWLCVQVCHEFIIKHQVNLKVCTPSPALLLLYFYPNNTLLNGNEKDLLGFRENVLLLLQRYKEGN